MLKVTSIEQSPLATKLVNMPEPQLEKLREGRRRFARAETDCAPRARICCGKEQSLWLARRHQDRIAVAHL